MKINKIQLCGIYMFLALDLFILITGESPYQYKYYVFYL
jgi:hypothetical protein